MSSTRRPSALQSQPPSLSPFPVAESGGGATKKKFGKNLNKLTKPPAPPVSSGSSSSAAGAGGGAGGGTFRGSASSRNGLLLLSTKSKSKASSSSAGGGLLGSKAASSLQRDSSAPRSAHDALLSAAAGRAESDGRGPAQMTPAWGGAAEKQPSLAQPSPLLAPDKAKAEDPPKPALVLAPRGGKRASFLAGPPQGSDLGDRAPAPSPSPVSPSPPADLQEEPKRSDSRRAQPDVSRTARGDGSEAGVVKKAAPDNAKSNVTNGTEVFQVKEKPHGGIYTNYRDGKPQQDGARDDQLQFMSKLAKERAEKVRSEEEARVLKQKERAALRLKELEGKMAAPNLSPNDQPTHSPRPAEANVPSAVHVSDPSPKATSATKIQTRIQTHRDVPGTIGIGQPSSQIVLERLGKPKKIISNSSKTSSNIADRANSSVDTNGGRALFNPNRTFSSLVGGSKSQKVTNGKEENGHVRMKIVDTHSSTQTHREKNPAADPPYDNDDHPPVQMIQLNRYDDRDRGDRSNGNGPRMLFDPKSGSMVAVPSREDSGLSAKGGKKAKQKNRKEHDHTISQKSPISKRSEGPRDVTKILSRRPDDIGTTYESSDPKTTRKQKGRKEEHVAQQKDKKRVENKGDPPETRGRQNSVGNVPAKHQKQPSKFRIPRTCGVLFVMDENGNYVSADGCEADQGFGAHSVPGGRVRNPTAYAKIMERQQQQQHQNDADETNVQYPNPASDKFSGDQFTFNDRVRNDPSFLKHQTDFEEQQQRLLAEAWSSLLEDEPKHNEPDVDDSPSPKSAENSPTFSGNKTWAPIDSELPTQSQNRFIGPKQNDDSEDDITAALAINPTIIGLGFDPTKNMDSVMIPPAIKSGTGTVEDDHIDLAKFALEAASIGSTNSPNPFGPLGVSGRFLGSSTWGTGPSGANAPLGDISSLARWDFASSSDAGATGSSNLIGSSTEKTKSAHSFISFPPLSTNHDNAWGSSAFEEGLAGFGSFGRGSNDTPSGAD